MVAILGTVARWNRSGKWSKDNRIYEDDGYIKIIRGSGRCKYTVVFDIKIYFCDSSDLETPVVIRTIKDIEIESKGNKCGEEFKKWIKDIVNDESILLAYESENELTGLVLCNKRYSYKINEDETECVCVRDVPKEVIEFIKGHERSAKNLTASLMKFKALPDLVTEYKKSIAYMTTKAMNMRIKYDLVGIDLYTIQ